MSFSSPNMSHFVEFKQGFAYNADLVSCADSTLNSEARRRENVCHLKEQSNQNQHGSLVSHWALQNGLLFKYINKLLVSTTVLPSLKWQTLFPTRHSPIILAASVCYRISQFLFKKKDKIIIIIKIEITASQEDSLGAGLSPQHQVTIIYILYQNGMMTLVSSFQRGRLYFLIWLSVETYLTFVEPPDSHKQLYYNIQRNLKRLVLLFIKIRACFFLYFKRRLR